MQVKNGGSEYDILSTMGAKTKPTGWKVSHAGKIEGRAKRSRPAEGTPDGATSETSRAPRWFWRLN